MYVTSNKNYLRGAEVLPATNTLYVGVIFHKLPKSTYPLQEGITVFTDLEDFENKHKKLVDDKNETYILHVVARTPTYFTTQVFESLSIEFKQIVIEFNPFSVSRHLTQAEKEKSYQNIWSRNNMNRLLTFMEKIYPSVLKACYKDRVTVGIVFAQNNLLTRSVVAKAVENRTYRNYAVRPFSIFLAKHFVNQLQLAKVDIEQLENKFGEDYMKLLAGTQGDWKFDHETDTHIFFSPSKNLKPSRKA